MAGKSVQVRKHELIRDSRFGFWREIGRSGLLFFFRGLLSGGNCGFGEGFFRSFVFPGIVIREGNGQNRMRESGIIEAFPFIFFKRFQESISASRSRRFTMAYGVIKEMACVTV